MTAYLIRRAGTSLVILIGISIFVFVLLHAVFPSPAIVILGPKASPQAVAAFNAQNGYDGPVIVQYWHYIRPLYSVAISRFFLRLVCPSRHRWALLPI